MIYRFDRDWNGEVAPRRASSRSSALHYPAADIPAQARRLDALNWLRIIPVVLEGSVRVSLSTVASTPILCGSVWLPAGAQTPQT